MIGKPHSALRWAAGVLVVTSSALTMGLPFASSAQAAATAITASPSSQSAPVGGSATVNVTTTGTPAHLEYTVVNGPEKDNAQPSAFPNGVACTSNTVCTVSNTSNVAGTDDVRVFDDVNNNGKLDGGDVQATSDVNVSFVAAPDKVTISPHGPTAGADTCQAYTITATTGGSPAGGYRMDLTATENTGTGSGTPLSFCTPSNGTATTTDGNTNAATTPATNPASNTDTLTGHVNTGPDGTVTVGVESDQAGTVSFSASSHSSSASDETTETVTGGQSGNAAVANLKVIGSSTYTGYTHSTATFTLEATDSQGNPVKGATVSYISSAPDTATYSGNSTGPDCTGGTGTTAPGTGQITCSITNGGPAGTDNITFYVNNPANVPNTNGPDTGEAQATATATFNSPPTATGVTITCPGAGTEKTNPDTNACTIPTSQNAVTFTAHVTNGTTPVQGAIVNFTTGGTASSTNATPRSGSATTDASGNATYTVTDTAPANNDTVSATATFSSFSATATATYATPAASTGTLTPQLQDVTYGGTVTVVAKVTDQFGNPIAGDSIAFQATGRNSQVKNVTTGSDGTATFTYTDTGTGTTGTQQDTISATDTTHSGVTFTSATVDYISGSTTASSVTVDTSGAGNATTCPPASGATSAKTGVTLGTVTEVCAVVKNSDGQTLAGKTVTFTVDKGAVGAHGSVTAATTSTSYPTTTDGSGIAIADVVSNTSGTQTVTATSDVAGTGTISYTAPAATAARNVTLSPQNPSIAPSGSQQFTATVTDQYGNPVPGVSVIFTTTGSGQFGAASSVTAPTGTGGTASATLTVPANGGGSGSVTADITNSGANACGDAAGNPAGTTAGNCTATTNYTVTTIVPKTLTLSPSSGTKAGGTESVIATLTNSDGSAASDVVVRFTVSGANSASGSASTDANGVATFSYTAAKAGTDSLSAYADVNDNGVQDSGEPSATATAHISTPPPPKVTEKPTLSLSSPHKAELHVHAVTHPHLKGKTVHFYTVSGSHHHLIGSAKTNSHGVASKTLHLKAGKTYHVDCRVVGLSSSKYHSEYSSTHKKKTRK